MTARIIDVGAGDIIDREGINDAIDPILGVRYLRRYQRKAPTERLSVRSLRKSNS